MSDRASGAPLVVFRPARACGAPKLRRVQGYDRYLPIVDDGKVVGTVSRFDFGGFELDRLDEENPLVRERI